MAYGTEPLHYQWYYEDNLMPGMLNHIYIYVYTYN